MDCNKLDTRLDTRTSFPSLLASVARLWLLATCTVHFSVSAIMQTASAMGSSRTGCCGGQSSIFTQVTHTPRRTSWRLREVLSMQMKGNGRRHAETVLTMCTASYLDCVG